MSHTYILFLDLQRTMPQAACTQDRYLTILSAFKVVILALFLFLQTLLQNNEDLEIFLMKFMTGDALTPLETNVKTCQTHNRS